MSTPSNLTPNILDDDIDIRDVRKFIAGVREKYNYDFSNYAMSSFKRRIVRLLRLYHMKHVDELLLKISQDRVFLENVVNEITVNTTEMFRDPSFWRKLRDDIFPQLARNQNIYIWHAACSSGEEVYSMCILLKELNLLDRVNLIATDINDEVLKSAKTGIYARHNLEINTNNFIRYGGKSSLSDYYTLRDDQTIQMDMSLIENVKFRKHDLVTGAPFSKFDLILCRNVLIYFNFELQDTVMNLFDQSLFSGGHLAIGSKETIAWSKSAKHYRTISVEEKIYRRLNSNEITA